MARPGAKPTRPSKSVVRKIVSERLGDFDEQVWPVNLAILVFAGFVTGIVLAATEDFFDPRPLYNGFVRLGVVALLVVALLVSTSLLQAPTARRVQFCVILSLFLHMILAVFLREQYMKLVAFLRDPTVGKVTVDEVITVPDYVEDTFEDPGALSEYEKPEKTTVPSERDSTTQITLEPPPVPSAAGVVDQAPPETPLPEEIDPLRSERQTLQTPERLVESLSSPKRQPDRDSTVLSDQAVVQAPVELKPQKSQDIAPQDQVNRESIVPDSLGQKNEIKTAEVIPPTAPPRTNIERNPQNPLAVTPRRQPAYSQSLSTVRPEISQAPLGGAVPSRELNPNNPSISQQTTTTPLVSAPSHVPSEQVWTPAMAPQLPSPREKIPEVGSLAQASTSRRNPVKQSDMLPSQAAFDRPVAQDSSQTMESALTSSLKARETNLTPSTGVDNPDANAMKLGSQAADNLSEMTAAMIRDHGVSRLGQAPGISTSRGEGETSGVGLDTADTTSQAIRARGKSSGLPSAVSPEIGLVGTGGPTPGGTEQGSSNLSGLGDKLAFRPNQSGSVSGPLLGAHSEVADDTGGILSSQGLGGMSGPMVPGMVRRSGDETLTGQPSGTGDGSPVGRLRQPGGGRLPGESQAELAGAPGGLGSLGLGGTSGTSQGQGGSGEKGSLQDSLSGKGQRGFELAGIQGSGPPKLLGSPTGEDLGSLTSSLLTGTTAGGLVGRPERISASAVVGRTAPGRTGGRRQLGGTADLDPSEAFRQRSPAQRGTTAAQYGGTPETEAAVERGLAFLARIQFPDGHWSLNRLPQSMPGDDKTFGLGEMNGDTAATAMSLLAFLGAGYTHQEPKYKDTVGRGLRWLIANQLTSGQLFRSDTDSTLYTQFYGHGLATIALCEAYGMTRDPALREPAEKAIAYILKSQSPEFGGWRYVPRKETDTSVTGWQLMALKSAQMAGLSVPGDAFQGVARWLDRAQVDEGARYVYNPYAGQTPSQSHLRLPNRAMTAEGLLMRIYLGWQPSHPALRRGAEFLKQNLPSFSADPNEGRDCYYWYYATQVMFQMQGEMWQTWNRQVQETLLKTQIQTGPWVGSWDPTQPVADRWGKEAGRLYVTAFHLLILEVYYRHLPLFKTLAP